MEVDKAMEASTVLTRDYNISLGTNKACSRKNVPAHYDAKMSN